jgi:thiamine transport system permease protein
VSRYAAELAPALPLVAFLLAFALVPAALLFGGGLEAAGGAPAFARVLADPVNQRAIENSVSEGAVSAALAVALGYPAGVFLGRTALPGRRALLAGMLVPFLLPTVSVALGVRSLFGAGGLLPGSLPLVGSLGHGFGGIVVANVIFNAPVVVLFTALAVESAPAELEETVASLGGSPWRAYRDAWAAPSLLAALAGGLLTFLFSALAFAGPILIGGAPWYTVEARVYALAQTLAEGPSAALLALLAAAMMAPLAIGYGWISARLRRSSRGRRRRPRPFDGRPTSWLLGGYTVALLGALAFLLVLIADKGLAPARGTPAGPDPIATLFSARITAELGVSTLSVLGNTVGFAAISTTIAALLALGAAFWVARRPAGAGWVQPLVFAPLLLSPVVLAFALQNAYRGVLGGPSAAPVLIVLSQATLALPFALPGLTVALANTDPRPAEAARALGARPLQAYFDVELPAIGPAIRGAVLFALALGLGEFTATNFLATPSATTLSVELYDLGLLRQGALSNTIGALLMLLSLAVFLAVALWGEPEARVL